MGRDKLPVVEIFKSVQGEGPYQGRYALFLRLGLCNLKCKFCDTKYALTPGKNWRYVSPETLANELIRKYSDALFHFIITGGEPMLHEALIKELVGILLNRIRILEIETNGTIFPQFLHKFSFITFNVSPKLENSGEKAEKRIIKEVLELYSNLENAYFKFVISSEKDIEEVLAIKKQFYIPNNKIFLMPMGATKKEVRKNAQTAFKLAVKYGFNYSCRIQIEAGGRKKHGI